MKLEIEINEKSKPIAYMLISIFFDETAVFIIYNFILYLND